jgi:cell division protein FtsZ
VTGGENLSMYEVNEAARVITSSADPNAKIIFGAVIDESIGDEVKITVIATGFGKGAKPALRKIKPQTISPFEIVEREEKSAQGRSVFGGEEKKISWQASPRPTPPPRPISAFEPEKKTKEEEDLEIPAFIRKKMM